MVTLLELFEKTLPGLDFRMRLTIPGKWEELQTDPADSRSKSLWAHRLAGGFADCVLEILHSELPKTIVIVARPAFTWQGHELQIGKGQELRRIPVSPLVPNSGGEEILSAIAVGIEECRKRWKVCSHCDTACPIEYMEVPQVCMGCAPGVLGVVY